VLFGKNKTIERNILRLGVTINLSALPLWITSGEKEVPVVPYTEWHHHESFEYLIYVLPVEEGRDWYFHKNVGEYSHSINAIIELGDYFEFSTEMQNHCDGLPPDLEIELWNGQMSIAFCRKLILMAPLGEAISIIDRGKTSNESFAEARKREIEVPIAFNNSGEPSECMPVYEWTDDRGAGYSNQLAHFWMDSPRGPVVVRSS